MNKVLSFNLLAGLENMSKPRLVREILLGYFSTSNEPLAKGYRKFLASKENNAEKGGEV